MANFSKYVAMVELLLEVLPLISEHHCFALKGGTAINLFVRNMPRLSVDIDLTYLPIENRTSSLANIEDKLKILSNQIQAMSNNKYQVNAIINPKENMADTLLVQGKNTQIKIEVNPVVRGCVFGTELTTLCTPAQDKFLLSFDTRILSIADLYGSKICATLSRHKPRDLFDVMLLLENEGITDQIRQAAIVYIASTNRPIHELLSLAPNLENLKKEYHSDLEGMTVDKISYKQLEDTMYILIKHLLSTLTTSEREFLLSVKQGAPQWKLFPTHGIDKLPGLQWKILNINKLKKENPNKHQEELNKLKKVLAL